MSISFSQLEQFCTDEQDRKMLQLLGSGMPQQEVAREMGIGVRTLQKRLADLKLSLKNPSLMVGNFDEPIKEPLIIKGISTFYDNESGEAIRTWVKTDVDKTLQLKMILESFEMSIKGYKPLKKVKAPKRVSKDTLIVVPMGDPHIGMYAWAGDSGEDFDCAIAERDLRKAMAYLIEKTPPSETCLILNLGDFFHADNQRNTTAKSNNALDVDTRWARVLQIGITLMVDCIELALNRHKNVIVKNNIGNHDDHTSQVLSICLQHAFKDNPRVEIASPADPFFALEFGVNMVVSAHGDKAKAKQMPGIVANYYPEIWGRTQHRLALMGHLHHEDRYESNGLVVETVNTLAASDNWHYGMGFRSQRNMKILVLDRHEGEMERYTFSLSRKMLQSYKVV